MARTARPVNPDEGPVQAFAHDLRALREAAGNPTYRVLAKSAGFSATTLGDAAGGVRLPSLEVTLAYVGACGGDSEAWRSRWQEVSQAVAAERAVAERGAAQQGDGEPVGAEHVGGEQVGEEQAGEEPAAAPLVEERAQREVGEVAEGGEQAGTAEGALGAGSAIGRGVEEGEPSVQQSVSGAQRVEEVQDLQASDDPRGDATDAEELTEFVGFGRQGKWRERRPSSRYSLLSVIAVLVIAGVLAWRLPAMDHSSKPAAAVIPSASLAAGQCPTFPSKGAFSGLTYLPGTHIRVGASLGAASNGTVPPGCELQFTGYCLGDVIMSSYSDSPDMRWFELSGGGLVASAIIHGDPPPGMQPSSCTDDVPPPAQLTMSIDPSSSGGGVIGLRATGSQLWIVGFAALYPGAPGEVPQWHQLGIVSTTTTYFSALLHSGQIGDPTRPVPVVADACYGGQAPTQVDAVGMIQPSDATDLQPMQLNTSDLTEALNVACAYPSGN